MNLETVPLLGGWSAMGTCLASQSQRKDTLLGIGAGTALLPCTGLVKCSLGWMSVPTLLLNEAPCAVSNSYNHYSSLISHRRIYKMYVKVKRIVIK